MTRERVSIEFYDYKPAVSDFKKEVLAGLSKNPKRIPPKFFYDQAGSELFEEITRLPEYYLTRSEREILNKSGKQIASMIGDESLIIEYGSGSSNKTGIILEHFSGNTTYMPVDISGDHLFESSEMLKRKFPDIRIIAVCADYSLPVDLPIPRIKGKKAVLFLGSTIGNMEPANASEFVKRTCDFLDAGDLFLIGFDLKKDPEKIDLAYNDSEGVTARFNRNLLERINREFGAQIDISKFRHKSFYNVEKGRIEMHLESVEEQTVELSGIGFNFRKGETIHTENSYKYSVEEIADLSMKSGFSRHVEWYDEGRNFSLSCFIK